MVGLNLQAIQHNLSSPTLHLDLHEVIGTKYLITPIYNIN